MAETKIKPGDNVKLLKDVKDHYGEVWHEKGEIIKVKYIHSDGIGLMFWSDLGLNPKFVEKVDS